MQQWVRTGELRELTERLTLAGLEVARVEAAGGLSDRENVVVGQIVSVDSHPDTERLAVCRVDVGNDEVLTVVCGAPNARKNLVTACARAGANLPGMQVKTRTVRGVKSEGMLCSAMELGLDNTAEGIIELDDNAPLGCGVVEYLDLSDPVMELELTPNRGDCLSMTGVAREVAVLTGVPLAASDIGPVAGVVDEALTIELEAPGGCPRYVGRAIRNIDMSARTPDWMAERLRRSGMRSISPIVDITNYVMHELGQPMHAFDLDRIRGGIRVRMAHPKEQLALLDGNEVELDGEYLVIADHERAIALAGIMGGAETAISGETRDIYLESAFFSPDMIRGKARLLGMQTNASHRFERGVDYEMQLRAMERATELVLQITGGEPGPVTHAACEDDLPRREPISFREREIERTLGCAVETDGAERIMRDLGISLRPEEGGWRAIPPSWRFDIQGPHDLVEEVGRCHGFDAIAPRVLASVPEAGRRRETDISAHDMKLRMMALGYHEAVTYSFVDPGVQDTLTPDSSGTIMLKNPIAENMSAMRKSLWPGLLDAARTNLRRQERRVRLFEIGTVFLGGGSIEDRKERVKMAAVACGSVQPRQWGATETDIDFFDLKGDLVNALSLAGGSSNLVFRKCGHPALQPGQGAEILLDDRCIGLLGKLHPARARALDIDADLFMLEVDMECFFSAELPRFAEMSRFPPIHRDLALVVEETVEVSLLEDEIRVAAGNLLQNITLFDVFKGKNLEDNTKSLAFGLTFQSKLGNLTAMEVDKLIENIVSVLKSRANARLRE